MSKVKHILRRTREKKSFFLFRLYFLSICDRKEKNLQQMMDIS